MSYICVHRWDEPEGKLEQKMDWAVDAMRTRLAPILREPGFAMGAEFDTLNVLLCYFWRTFDRPEKWTRFTRRRSAGHAYWYRAFVDGRQVRELKRAQLASHVSTLALETLEDIGVREGLECARVSRIRSKIAIPAATSPFGSNSRYS